jgi:hypothetical protein
MKINDLKKELKAKVIYSVYLVIAERLGLHSCHISCCLDFYCTSVTNNLYFNEKNFINL